MTRSIADLPNLGPKMAVWLAEVGVHDAATLGALGPAAAYLRLRGAGFPVSLNALWAMEGALTGHDWREIDSDRKAELRAAVAFDGTDL